jgi:hypothetical protein
LAVLDHWRVINTCDEQTPDCFSRKNELVCLQLKSFTDQNYTSGRISLVGLGVDHGDLLELAGKFDVTDGPGASKQKARYIGGRWPGASI